MDMAKTKKPMGKGAMMPPPKPKKVAPVTPAMEDDGPTPSDIQDVLQTNKNEKAYQNYEKRRAVGDPYKKGGSVKSSASKRADGIAIRGKTRGKMC